jgi:hypothetical protein
MGSEFHSATRLETASCALENTALEHQNTVTKKYEWVLTSSYLEILS